MTSDSRSFSLAFSRARGSVIVHVSGALDADGADELKERLDDVIDGQGNRQVVVDLRATTSIVSAGFSVLVDARNRLESQGGELVLSAPASSVARDLAVAGLERSFPLTAAWDHPSYGGARGQDGSADSGRSA